MHPVGEDVVLLACPITPLGLSCRVSDPRSNQRALYNHDTRASRRSVLPVGGSGHGHMRANRRPPSAYRRQLGSIVRELQLLLRSAAKRVFALSTEAHEPSANLPSVLPLRCV
jgi:hypothetical protein